MENWRGRERLREEGERGEIKRGRREREERQREGGGEREREERQREGGERGDGEGEGERSSIRVPMLKWKITLVHNLLTQRCIYPHT